MNGNTFILDLAGNYARNLPWYKKYANAVTAGIIGLLSVLAVIASLGFAEHPAYVAAASIIGLVAQVFGVTRTKNQANQSVVNRLNELAGQNIDAHAYGLCDHDHKAEEPGGKHRLNEQTFAPGSYLN